MLKLEDKTFASSHGQNVRHGFFGREGGVSSGIYSSLNCGIGSNDNRDAVIENRARVAAAMQARALLSLNQVHGRACLRVDTPWEMLDRPEADAMITDRPGIALGILTADCGPLLFSAQTPEGRPVVAVAHAGWKGALYGAINSTLAAYRDFGIPPDRIAASIGPCIGPASYEVDEKFRATFAANDADSPEFFTAAIKPGHFMFDLPGYCAMRLRRLGVGTVSGVGLDTCADENRLFSYRRATLRGEPDYGRQVSAIVIAP